MRRYYLLGIIPCGPWGQWQRDSLRWCWRLLGSVKEAR